MKPQLPLATQAEMRERGHDLDTIQYGIDGPFEHWEGDNTALVHVLWDAHRAGLDLHGDASQIAAMIQHSRWFAAAAQNSK